MRPALLCFLFALLSAGPAHGLTVAAASSLRQVMPDLEDAFRAQHGGADLRVIHGASGKLATQIINGAPYDVFLSADTAYPEEVGRRGAADSAPEIYALGRLVLWWDDPQREAMTPTDLSDETVHRIAIAQPRHAPYGQRAREALKALDLWQSVEPRLVYGENIGQAAAMVESGAADAGLVAWSLTFTPGLAGRPFTLIDQTLHEPLAMALVITRQGAAKPEARRFSEFLQSEAARSILRRFGFESPDPD